MSQMQWPVGMVGHVVELRPATTMLGDPALGTDEHVVYPMDQVKRGYITIEAEDAEKIEVGSEIQVDRYHATVDRIGKAHVVTCETHEDRRSTTKARRVYLTNVRWI